MERQAVVTVQATDPDAESVYQMYYQFSSPVSRLQNHQILAINRGEKEGFLKVSATLPGLEGQALVCRMALKPTMHVSAFVRVLVRVSVFAKLLRACSVSFDRMCTPVAIRRR